MRDEAKYVKLLIQMAAHSANQDEAMKYAQAALNAANAMCSLRSALAPPD